MEGSWAGGCWLVGVETTRFGGDVDTVVSIGGAAADAREI